MWKYGYRKELVDLIRVTHPNPTSGAEIGVHRGSGAATLLKEFPSLTLHLVDNWLVPKRRCKEEHKATTLKRIEFAKDRAVVRHLASVEAARLYPDNCFDFVFIDADHSYVGVRDDLIAWYPKTKSGGLFCGHDYKDDTPGVIQAVDEWAAETGYEIQVTDRSVWWCLKRH